MPSRNGISVRFSAMDAPLSLQFLVVKTTICASAIIVTGKAIPTHRSILGRLLIIIWGAPLQQSLLSYGVVSWMDWVVMVKKFPMFQV